MRTGILEAALDPEGLSTTARAVPAASLHNRGTADYERHRPETTALYEFVRDNSRRSTAPSPTAQKWMDRAGRPGDDRPP